MARAKNPSIWRNVPERDRVILWARAAGRCCFPDCRLELIEPATTLDDDAIFGQAAHVVAHSSKGPRANPHFPADQLDKYENLVLLCGNHHTIVDKQANTYTVEDLQSWKAEHEGWVKIKTSPDEYVPLKWQVVIQEDQPQIDHAETGAALKPDAPASQIHHVSSTGTDWARIATEQRQQIEQIISSVSPSERRFAIFSLTKIANAIHLGFVFSDRCRSVPFQYDRQNRTWKWPDNTNKESGFNALAIRDYSSERGAVVLRVSLSATVEEKHVLTTVPAAIGEVHLSVQQPSVNWLQSRSQLVELLAKYRETFEEIRTRFGDRCTSIHVLYAGPTGGAIELGRAVNPRMLPKVQTYEYDLNRTPAYSPAIGLEG